MTATGGRGWSYQGFPNLLYVTLWYEHVMCHPAYLQVSDVVHDGPPLDRKALGGDVVVVDLQSNKYVSERSAARLRWGACGATGSATRGPRGGGAAPPHSLVTHLSIHN